MGLCQARRQGEDRDRAAPADIDDAFERIEPPGRIESYESKPTCS